MKNKPNCLPCDAPLKDGGRDYLAMLGWAIAVVSVVLVLRAIWLID